MNCVKFEAVIVDLARGQMMDAGAREGGLAHARECARCGARLAAEQRLTAGMRALAAGDDLAEAPVALEATLRAAFRQQATLPAPAALTRRFPVWPLVAAAGILVAFGLIINSWLRRPPASQPGVEVSGPPAPAPSPTRALPTPPSELAETRRPPRVHRPAGRPGDAARRLNPAPMTDEAELGEVEVATGFLPLIYDGLLPPLESGQVIRVEVPRFALISYGLPLNAERADEPIKADVLLGQDGLARAIRLVH